ncbi:ATP-grasp domain-containing protein [Alkaliphilus serpentinus]|uniref:ATP-grasp domain-containing protein n=1 Tax=Alkaliphilus serpentinus TaxID=1482731 RepID=A0A833HM11_9FIRM|nr:ATP-grasp domain-containing protein [Alkaliphilus serpentinus]KAB3527200.1 ATP-grasp domain-containing protein [Alkaliphilus serpentinus]
MNKVEILIISDTMDFTTDYICLELQRRNASYLRINRDKFQDYRIVLGIGEPVLNITVNSKKYIADNQSLKAIYYRAPIYLHDTFKPNLSYDEQLYRSQWTAFLRNLVLFENAKWMNNPISTFKAENKMVQLKYARKIGLKCPRTLLLNSVEEVPLDKDANYIMKSLDTVLLKQNDKESFVYSTVVTGEELMTSRLTVAPLVIQEYLYPKVDLRVTVVEDKVFTVKIIKDGIGVEGDWRKEKENVDFIEIDLPEDIQKKCIQIVSHLGLSFGGIDLILNNETYYFIEVNPTGEWAWLVNKSGLKIDRAICDSLQVSI